MYIEFCSEMYGVQYLNWIFVVVCFWIVDQVNYVFLQILYFVDVIVYGKICYVVVKVVDGEIVVLGIFFDRIEDVVVQQYIVLFMLGGCMVVFIVFMMIMKCCYFDNFWVKYYVSQVEMMFYQMVIVE